jgi:serine/threonine protein kinase
MEPLKKQDPKKIGPYSLIARLGSGGMGTVYLAAERETTVALKVVSGGFEGDSALQSRFIREIETLKKMRSPFIAGILDSKTQKDSAWLAVNYVNGPNVLQEVSRNGPLSDERVWELTISCLIALTQIHGLGVVHRDIKPANVLLSETGPKLIDFGISQRSDETSLTTTGLVAGSPAWLAPEQLDVGEVTGAADLFSLGSLLVFAASGHSPWGNQNTMSVPILFNKILSESPDLSSLTADLRTVILPALAKDPTQRPAATILLSRALQAAPADVLQRIRNWLELDAAQLSKSKKADPLISPVIREIDHLLEDQHQTTVIREVDQILLHPQQMRNSNKGRAAVVSAPRHDPRAVAGDLAKRWPGLGIPAVGLVAIAGLIAGALLVSIVLPNGGVPRVGGQTDSSVDSAVPQQTVAPPSYVFTTVSDSGIATLSPGDGSEVASGEEFDIELSFREPVVFADTTGPEIGVVGLNAENADDSCLGTRTLESSADDPLRFVFRCGGLPEGTYIIRAVWSVEDADESDASFERETITAFVEIRKTPPTEASSNAAVAGPSGGLRYEFMGGGWGAWDDAQYFSMSGNALVRSWCLRSAPGWAWRDDNNWAEILNPDGSIADRVASTQNRGACTITGSVNGMEDGNPGELRAIVVPVSTLLPRIVPGECVIVRFKPGGSSNEPEFNDICVRG